jgi:hypothetical protein
VDLSSAAFDDTPVTRRTVPLEVRFHGSGVVTPVQGGVQGGVVAPEAGDAVAFSVWREVPDEDGHLNPVVGEDTVAGAFQLSLEGTASGFRELARYLLGIAELDVNADLDFHEHHELTSADGRTQLHVIVRRRA